MTSEVAITADQERTDFVAHFIKSNDGDVSHPLYKALIERYGAEIAVRTIQEKIDSGEIKPSAGIYRRFADDLHAADLRYPALHYYEEMYKQDNGQIIAYAEYVLNNFRKEKGREIIEDIDSVLPRIPGENKDAQYYLLYYKGRLLSMLATTHAECVMATKHLWAALTLRPACSACIAGIQYAAVKQHQLESKALFDLDKSVSDLAFEDLGVAGSYADVSRERIKETGGQARKRLWHITEQVKYFPTALSINADYKVIVNEIARNAAPEKPLFSRESKILTVESCFAGNFRKWLLQRNYPVVKIGVPEQLNNSLAIRGFFDWCLTGSDRFTQGGYQVGQGRELYRFGNGIDSAVYREVLESVNGVIITLGLGQIWRDKLTGDVFWHAIPEHLFDPDRHEPMVSEVSWNVDNIQATIDLIRTQIGDVPIILTLSPVPLNAAFRGESVWEADCVSKSVLRAALDVVVSKRPPNVYYWPAFEMVRWTGAHLAYSTFSWTDDPDQSAGYSCDAQHPRQGVIKHITDAFHRYYYAPES